jgi:GNAT superfamily N-acetyltransferase
MNFTIEFSKPIIQGNYEWQLAQEINVKNDNGDVIAKAEIELLTINKHRDALATYQLLEDEGSDWEIPLNIYFKKQNLTLDLCDALEVKPSTKAQTHILLEAISVLPEYRQQGVAKYLLQNIAQKHAKIQSINVLSMAMNEFVDAQLCETQSNKDYYSTLDLPNETIARETLENCFTNSGFTKIDIDQAALVEPLQFDIFVASPASILAALD